MVLRPNKGAVIAQPTREETREIFEARRAVERALVELAVPRASAADIAALREQLAGEHEAMHRFDQPSWARLASGFHLRIGALAGNTILHNYLTELVSRCSLIVRCLRADRAMRPASTMSTRLILDCMEARDAAGALAHMDAHLRGLEARIETSRMPGEKSLGALLGITST